MDDPVGSTTLLGALGIGLGSAVLWGSTLVLKRFGIRLPSTAASANEQAQKDMLDWQREQLASEVARREKAETNVQDLLKQLNEMNVQIGQLKRQVEDLTRVVEQFKAQVAEGKT